MSNPCNRFIIPACRQAGVSSGISGLFQKSQRKNLTTQLIIDIWESTFRKKKEQIIKSKREGGDGKGTLIFQRILFKIEGGDYEGVQSFSERG